MGVSDELLKTHFFLLFGVVRVCCQHDDRVGEGEQFISVVEGLFVLLVERQGKLPDDSLDLLRLPWKSEFRKQFPQGKIILHILEIERVTKLMEDFHNFLIVLAKVLTQDFFVETFDAQEVLGNDFFNTLLLVFLVLGGFIRLGFDLFNAFEMTGLRFELVFFVFVFFFFVYFQNQRFNSQRRFFVELQDKLLRSLVVQFHIQH